MDLFTTSYDVISANDSARFLFEVGWVRLLSRLHDVCAIAAVNVYSSYSHIGGFRSAYTDSYIYCRSNKDQICTTKCRIKYCLMCYFQTPLGFWHIYMKDITKIGTVLLLLSTGSYLFGFKAGYSVCRFLGHSQCFYTYLKW